MARFYGSMKGHGSRTNTKMGQGSIQAHIRTWDHGVFVEYAVSDHKNNVKCRVWLTGGSNDPTKKKLIKEFAIDSAKAPNKRPGPDSYGNPRGNEVMG